MASERRLCLAALVAVAVALGAAGCGADTTTADRRQALEDYVAAVVCEWGKMNFDLTNLEPDDYRGIRTITDLENFIKSQARNEVESKTG